MGWCRPWVWRPHQTARQRRATGACGCSPWPDGLTPKGPSSPPAVLHLSIVSRHDAMDCDLGAVRRAHPQRPASGPGCAKDGVEGASDARSRACRSHRSTRLHPRDAHLACRLACATSGSAGADALRAMPGLDAGGFPSAPALPSRSELRPGGEGSTGWSSPKNLLQGLGG